MKHSKSHDRGKIQEKFETKGLVPSPHPPYSLELSPCDFWFLGMAKRKMKDREFHTVQNILGHVMEIWNDLTFEDVQSVLLEWQMRLNRVIENGGYYYSESSKKNGNLFGQHSQGILSAAFISR
jgi:hypothetical protein